MKKVKDVKRISFGKYLVTISDLDGSGYYFFNLQSATEFEKEWMYELLKSTLEIEKMRLVPIKKLFGKLKRRMQSDLLHNLDG